MKVTAILLGYYEQRKENLIKSIHALRKGTYVPDEIVVFNNNFYLDFFMLHINIIKSKVNLGHRARFITALLYQSDYYFFIDDDMAVGPETIERFVENADENTCLTTFGRRIGVHERFRGNEIDKNKIVDYAEGVGSIFCSRKAIIKMLELEDLIKDYPEYNEGREADIILTMANKTKVIATDEYSSLVALGQKGVGMFMQENHEKLRNDIIQRIIKVRGGAE